MLTFGILECQYLVGGDVDMVSKIYYVRYLVDSLSDGYLAAVRLNYTFAEVRKNIKMYDASVFKNQYCRTRKTTAFASRNCELPRSSTKIFTF